MELPRKVRRQVEDKMVEILALVAPYTLEDAGDDVVSELKALLAQVAQRTGA